MRLNVRRRRRQARRRAVLRFLVRRFLPAFVLVAAAAHLWPRAHAWLRTSPAFEVARVVVKGNVFLTPHEIASIAGIRPGMPFIEVRPGEATGRLLMHPRVQRAELSWAPLRGLRIEVVERLPVALLERERLLPLSADGLLLPPVPGRQLEDLPVLIPPPSCRVEGDVVCEESVLEALRFLAGLGSCDPKLSGSISALDLTNPRFTRVYLDTLSTALLYEQGGSWRPHLRALPAIVDDITKREIAGSVLDLRFREQIVRRGGHERADHARALDRVTREHDG